MKKLHLLKKLFIGTSVILTTTLAHAGTPLWTFAPLNATTATVTTDSSISVVYNVTNQSKSPHTLVMTPIQGIISSGCTTPLNAHQSCTLTLNIAGNTLQEAVVGGPILCEQNNPLECYRPSTANSLNITKGEISNYSVGGTITGLAGTVTLLNNGTESLITSTNGTFTFPTAAAAGSTYSVTVSTQPATQTCTVSNSSGTISNSKISNVAITCATHTYSVGGEVTGLTAGTIVLQNNNSDFLSISVNDSFTFPTFIAEGSPYKVTVKTQPIGSEICAVSNGEGTMGSNNITNVTVTCHPSTTLSFFAPGIIPVSADRSLSGTIMVTNMTANPAYNVHVSLPTNWTTVEQNNCAVLLGFANCTLTLTSTAPYVAQNVMATGDNVSSATPKALGFSIDNYLVFSLPSSSTALVVDANDRGPVAWSTAASSFYSIWGISEISTISNLYPNATQPSGEEATLFIGQANCSGRDGACNSNNIVVYNTNYATDAPVPTTNYAAGICYQITSDNSGSVAQGTWYLPAICQLGGPGELAACTPSTDNIQTNLYALGFLSELGTPGANYWSSNEYSANPASRTWLQIFYPSSIQSAQAKVGVQSIRCVRAITWL